MQLEDLNKHIKALGYGITNFQYDAEAFGSWFAVLEISGRSWRLMYEGREKMIILQETSQNGWQNIKSERVSSSDDELLLLTVTEWLNQI